MHKMSALPDANYLQLQQYLHWSSIKIKCNTLPACNNRIQWLSLLYIYIQWLWCGLKWNIIITFAGSQQCTQ
jgi:hypothetical protein